MKRESRLRKPGDFKKVFKEGKRFSSPHFILYMHKGTLEPAGQACLPARQARIGVSISKSHFKLATRRNRLRRVAKELFKKELNHRFKEYDFVIASRAAYPGPNINEAVRELRYLMTKPSHVNI